MLLSKTGLIYDATFSEACIKQTIYRLDKTTEGKEGKRGVIKIQFGRLIFVSENKKKRKTKRKKKKGLMI